MSDEENDDKRRILLRGDYYDTITGNWLYSLVRLTRLRVASDATD